MPCHRKYYPVVCLFWLFIDIVFELGQKFKNLSIRIIPDWFECVPFLENSRNFFLYGNFDIFDLTAVIAGAVTAYLFLLTTRERGQVA